MWDCKPAQDALAQAGAPGHLDHLDADPDALLEVRDVQKRCMRPVQRGGQRAVVPQRAGDVHRLRRGFHGDLLVAGEVRDLREPGEHMGAEVLVVVPEPDERLAQQLHQRRVDHAGLVVLAGVADRGARELAARPASREGGGIREGLREARMTGAHAHVAQSQEQLAAVVRVALLPQLVEVERALHLEGGLLPRQRFDCAVRGATRVPERRLRAERVARLVEVERQLGRCGP